MKYLFGGYPRGFLTVPLLNILWSLVLAGLAWFFVFIFFGEKAEFLNTWRWTYIYSLIFWFSLDFLAICLRGLAGLYLSRKFVSSFGDVMEAMVKHQLFKKNRHEFLTWTPEVFKSKLSEARSISRIAASFAKALLGSF